LAVKINYKELRKISPETARQAVVDYWQNNGGNIAEVARTFGINRCVVYDILHKWSEIVDTLDFGGAVPYWLVATPC
jgi:transposase-like protein